MDPAVKIPPAPPANRGGVGPPVPGGRPPPAPGRPSPGVPGLARLWGGVTQNEVVFFHAIAIAAAGMSGGGGSAALTVQPLQQFQGVSPAVAIWQAPHRGPGISPEPTTRSRPAPGVGRPGPGKPGLARLWSGAIQNEKARPAGPVAIAVAGTSGGQGSAGLGVLRAVGAQDVAGASGRAGLGINRAIWGQGSSGAVGRAIFDSVPPPQNLGVAPVFGNFGHIPAVARPGPGRPGLSRFWKPFQSEFPTVTVPRDLGGARGATGAIAQAGLGVNGTPLVLGGARGMAGESGRAGLGAARATAARGASGATERAALGLVRPTAARGTAAATGRGFCGTSAIAKNFNTIDLGDDRYGVLELSAVRYGVEDV